MKPRWFSCLTLIALFALPAAASAQDKAPPTMVLRVRSIDSVLDNVKLLAEMAGKKDFGQQLEGLIKSKVGPKGLEGVDTKRAFGAYARLGDDLNDIAGVLMIPIADEKAFLGLLENVGYKASKKDSGIYQIEQDALPIDIGFRFASKYAYLTGLNLEAISPERLMTPEQVFPKDSKGLVSGAVRLDQIPKAARDLAKAKLEEEVTKEKEKEIPNESPAQKKLRAQLFDGMLRQIAAVIDEGAEVGGSLDIDHTSKELVIESHFSGKKQSKLAENIAELGKARSQFSGLLGTNSFMGGLLRVSLPADLRKALDTVIDEGKTAALAKETNPKRRKQAEAILSALEPTLRSGELDIGASFQTVGNTVALVLGLGVKDGDKLQTTIRQLIEDLPQTEKDKIKMDVSEVDGVKIHRIEAKLDAQGQALFGKDAASFVAFRSNAVLVSLGENGLAAIKAALEQKPGTAPLFQAEASVGKIVQTLGAEPQKAAATRIFTKKEDGKVRVTASGGSALNFTFRVHLSVLEFAAAVAVPRETGFKEQGN